MAGLLLSNTSKLSVSTHRWTGSCRVRSADLSSPGNMELLPLKEEKHVKALYVIPKVFLFRVMLHRAVLRRASYLHLFLLGELTQSTGEN